MLTRVLGILLAVRLLLGSAFAQSTFYTCQIVIPVPPATGFPAPAMAQTICPLDAQRLSNGSSGVGLILNFSANAVANVTVKVTGDQAPSPSGLWNNHDTLINERLSDTGNISFPVTGVGLFVNSWTQGTVTLSLVEGPFPR